jgi:hypothetical protein
VTDIPSSFGVVYGRMPDGLVWLRHPDARYKRLNPELLELLLQVGRGELAAGELDEGAREAAGQLAAEGFLIPGAESEERVPPPDIALAPRLLLFGACLAAVAGIVYVRQDLAWPPPPDPIVNLVAVPFFVLAALLHELGHWAACRPYFKAKIRFGMLNWVVPAVITKTNDAWACPRGIRVWINLAGPLVDLVLTLVLALVHLVFLPELRFLSTILLVQLLRVVFVLNPLLEGDGYWCLSDLLGVINLRSRGWSDLKRLRPSGYSLYTLISLAFTALCAYFLVRVLLALLGWWLG